jgi:hypothetical protein
VRDPSVGDLHEEPAKMSAERELPTWTIPKTPRERLLFWVEQVTRRVKDGGPANDENVLIEARSLYNLLHALQSYLEGDSDHSHLLRLEGRIRHQRHDLTVVQGKRRDTNVRVRSWHEGREALLKEQLRDAHVEVARLRKAAGA